MVVNRDLGISVVWGFMCNRIVKIRSVGHVFMAHLPRLEIALVPITPLNMYLHFIPWIRGDKTKKNEIEFRAGMNLKYYLGQTFGFTRAFFPECTHNTGFFFSITIH